MSKGSGLVRNLTILTGLSVATMHVINRLETTSACGIVPDRTREDKTYNWRYGKIDFKVKGYGSPVLLLHDMTIGSNKEEFSSIYEKLSEKHRIYIPDLLGYGYSDKPAMTYTASTYEDLIVDFIKNVIRTKTDIIATGTTAPIVIKAAHDNPKLINHIIMINPLGLYDQNLIPSTQTRLLKVCINTPVIGTFIYNMKCRRSDIEDIFISEYLYDPSLMEEGSVEEIVTSYFRAAHEGGVFAKHAYASYLSQYMTCSILSELQETDHSMLMIGGESEPDINDNIENYKYYNGAIESVIIPETAHLPHIEKPDEVINNIEVFLG